MLTAALSFLAGVCCLNMLAELPACPPALLLLLAAILLRVYYATRYVNCYAAYFALVACCVIAGFAWAQLHAGIYLDHRLPEPLAGRDIRVQGRIVDIPSKWSDVQRFVFVIESYETHGLPSKMPERLRVSWYYGPPVSAGESWQLQLRLKPPHGFMNPGGFDYEGWLFQQRLHATGYVRKDDYNRMLAPAPPWSVASLRGIIADLIAAGMPRNPFAGLVTALAVGERSSIESSHWNTLIATGTNHLMAISGLHVGLAAAFGFRLCRFVYPARLMQRLPAQQACLVFGLCMAFVYALLAGLSIPTQRALLMLVCMTGAWLLKRITRPLDVLAFALLAVLLWDPVAVLSAGFWFSFLAVAAIFHTLTGAISDSGAPTPAGRFLRALRSWGLLPLVIALALFPVSLYLFQQVSLVAPLANMFMVPWVSFLVVPLVLLGLMLATVSPSLATNLFGLAGWLFELAWPMLEWLSAQSFAVWTQASPSLPAVLLAMTGLAILLAPAAGRRRWLAVLLLVPVLSLQPAPPDQGDFELHVLDVGQGLASVILTRRHVLVYDTGARFSDRFDSGEAVVLPFLRSRGLDGIDLLMISHGDADHIGGAAALLTRWPQTPVSGQDTGSLTGSSASACRAGQRWRWDGVDFEVLHPAGREYSRRNNHSCVLRVVSAGGSVLLTGDIEENVERVLLQSQPRAIEADILVVPHHGSRTSSSADFIAAVSPQAAIFPSGYRNRYGFPPADIVRRYRQHGIELYATGGSGAISVYVDAETGPQPARPYRESRRRYWNHRVDMLPKTQAVEKPQGKVS